MLIDKLLEFSDSQGAITASAISSNVYDRAATPTLKDIGIGEPLWLVLQCDVTGTGTGTLTASLESDSTADLATSATVHWTDSARGGTAMVAGTTLALIPLPSGNYEEFIGMRYTISGTVGAVKLSAFIVKDVQKNIIYPSGFSVS